MSDPKAIKDFLEKSVRNVLTKTFNEGTGASRNDPKRIQKVRFSSFPFCGTRWFFDLPKLVTKASQRDYAFHYFTSVGTTVHEITQKVLSAFLTSNEGIVDDLKLYWDWKCTNKSCGHREYLEVEAPSECQECGGTSFSREEHEVECRGALGHTDTIVSLKLPPAIARAVGHSHGSIVIDYKTCTISATEARGKLPYPDNVAQISKYAGALQRSKKIPPMLGWVLVYMPRDIPFRFVVHGGYVSPEMGLKIRKQISGYVKEHTEWSRADNLKKVVRLYEERPCQSPDNVPEEFCTCEYKNLCTTGKGFTHLKNIFKSVESKLPIVREEE